MEYNIKQSILLNSNNMQMILEFVSFDSPLEVVNLELVCKEFRAVLNSQLSVVNEIWLDFIEDRWGVDQFTKEETRLKLSSKMVFSSRVKKFSLPCLRLDEQLDKVHCAPGNHKKEVSLAQEKLSIYYKVAQMQNELICSRLVDAERKTMSEQVQLIRKQLYSEDIPSISGGILRMIGLANMDPEFINEIIDIGISHRLVEILMLTNAQSLQGQLLILLDTLFNKIPTTVGKLQSVGSIAALVSVINDESIPLDSLNIVNALKCLANILTLCVETCQVVVQHEPICILYDRVLSCGELSDDFKVVLARLLEGYAFYSIPKNRKRGMLIEPIKERRLGKVRSLLIYLCNDEDDEQVLLQAISGLYHLSFISERECNLILKELSIQRLLYLFSRFSLRQNNIAQLVYMMCKRSETCRNELLRGGFLDTMWWMIKSVKDDERIQASDFFDYLKVIQSLVEVLIERSPCTASDFCKEYPQASKILSTGLSAEMRASLQSNARSIMGAEFSLPLV